MGELRMIQVISCIKNPAASQKSVEINTGSVWERLGSFVDICLALRTIAIDSIHANNVKDNQSNTIPSDIKPRATGSIVN